MHRRSFLKYTPLAFLAGLLPLGRLGAVEGPDPSAVYVNRRPKASDVHPIREPCVYFSRSHSGSPHQFDELEFRVTWQSHAPNDHFLRHDQSGRAVYLHQSHWEPTDMRDIGFRGSRCQRYHYDMDAESQQHSEMIATNARMEALAALCGP